MALRTPAYRLTSFASYLMGFTTIFDPSDSPASDLTIGLDSTTQMILMPFQRATDDENARLPERKSRVWGGQREGMANEQGGYESYTTW